MIAVIVFLNLLIASMNSTVQKIQDKQAVYWKYARAGTFSTYKKVIYWQYARTGKFSTYTKVVYWNYARSGTFSTYKKVV